MTDTPRTLWQPYYIWPREGAQHLDLAGEWALHPAGTPVDDPAQFDAWEYCARVPQTVHWTLHAAGALPHPYYHRNIKDYAWVETKTWYYRRAFDLPAAQQGKLAFLCFDGADYFSRVWLNGTLVGRHEGMFGGPMVEVSGLLRFGAANELVVEIPAGSFGQAADWDARSNKGRVIKPWGISRGSSAEDYMSVGLWQGVRLEFVGAAHLERPFIRTLSADPERAVLELSVEVLCGVHTGQLDFAPWHHCQVGSTRFDGQQWVHETPDRYLTQPWLDPLSLHIQVIEKTTGRVAATSEEAVLADAGRNWGRVRITLDRPQLWWPVGLGEPNLYRLELTLLSHAQPIDRLAFDFGIRTLETRPTPGPQTQDRWGDWQFVVNGQSFFVKGINWMPADQLLDLPADRYRWLLEMARDAGIQMIRIWGGGLIETEAFYDAADELGLMVWQDFPIGNGDSPEWPLDVWQAQVTTNIFRLRNRASLAVWCAGNEFNPYSTGNTAVVGIVERCVALLDRTRPFRRTSPDEGSIHTYPDMDPTWYDRLYDRVPWIAETGIHSFPEARLLRELVNPAELAQPLSDIFDPMFGPTHPDLRQHFVEYSPQRIPRMISRASQIDDVAAPTLETLAEASQISAGEFYQIFSELTQANYPVTAGLLPWVYKRPWPNIAIQLVNGMGHPGAPYYFLKRTYEPTHPMVRLPHLMWAPGEAMPLQAVLLQLGKGAMNGVLAVEVFDPALNSCWRAESPVDAAGAPSARPFDLGQFEIPASFTERFFFIVASCCDTAGGLIGQSVYWPRCLSRMADADFRTRYRNTPQPALSFTTGPWLKRQVAAQPTALQLLLEDVRMLSEARWSLSVRVTNAGRAPALPVSLEIDGAPRAFVANDNFFWLAPGETRQLDLRILWRQPIGQQPITVSASAWNAAATAQTIN